MARTFVGRGAKVVVSGRRPDVVSAAVADLRKEAAFVAGVAADVSTEEGRSRTLNDAIEAMDGLDILVNNAGGVRAGRLELISAADILAMIEVDLVAPILLTRDALPALRASGDAAVVNISSAIALVGVPFYTTYAAVKAGLAHFGEALRRELKGEGIHVLTAYPGATDTAMMVSNTAGPELGFARESASDVAAAVIDGIETGALSIVRGGEVRAELIARNRIDPEAVDERFLGMKSDLEQAVREHSAL